MTEQFMENISNEEHERLLLLCGHGIGPALSPADWRALCAELFEIVEEEYSGTSCLTELRSRTAAALAEQPVGPTDEELCETYRAAYYACNNRQGPAAQTYALRAVLERWGC